MNPQKILILIWLCVSCAFANSFLITENTTPKGQVYWAHKINDLGFVTFIFTFKNTGVTSDPLDKLGTVSMLCDVLQRGGGAYEEQEIAKVLKNIPCDLSVLAEDTEVFISVRVPKKDLSQAFTILQKILSKKDISQKKINLLVRQTIAGLEQSLHDPSAIARQLFYKQFIGDHPLNSQTKKLLTTLPALTHKDLTRALQNVFQKRNLQVTLVGDYEPEEWDQLLDTFTDKLYSDTKLTKIPKVQFKNLGQHKHGEYDVPQTVMFFASPSIDTTHDDFLPFALGMEMIGGSESELFKEVREKRGLVYYIGASAIGDINFPVVLGQAGFLPEKTTEVINIIKDVMGKAHTKLSDKKIQEYLTSAKHSFAFARTNTLQIAELMKKTQLLGRSLSWLSSYPERLAQLKPSNIKKALKDHIDVNKLIFTTVGRSPQPIPAKVQ